MKRLTILLLAAVTLTIILSGCFLLGSVSISERIDMFKEDMEDSQEDLWEHIHPDNDMKNSLKETSSWNPPFDFDGQNSYSFFDVIGSGDTRTATLSDSSNAYNGDTLTFTMKEDGLGVWYIMHLDLDDGSKTHEIF